MSGRKDGQTLFHRILPATAMGLTRIAAIDCHLKVKNKKCEVGLIEDYWITVSMQKISLFHKLIQQILGSHELTDHAHFWPSPPKNHSKNLFLSWIYTTMQKNKFIPSIDSWDTANFRVPWPDESNPFLAKPTQNFIDQLLIYVNFYQHAKNQATSLICSGDMVD